MIHKVEMELGGRTLSIESGRVARQADGAVLVQYADTVVLATVVASKEPREGQDFFPLFIEFREKLYAAGKIPGGFFKREGRPSEIEILASRRIDRPLRPLFPKGYMNEVQIIVSVLSSDQENDADTLGIIGASSALLISPIPFMEVVGAVRVGLMDGQMILNPTFAELEECQGEVVVTGTEDLIGMIEAEAKEISEQDVADMIAFGHEEIKRTCALQRELARACGKEKASLPVVEEDAELKAAVKDLALKQIEAGNRIEDKEARGEEMDRIRESVISALVEDENTPEAAEKKRQITGILEELAKTTMRRMILEEGRRVDGRGLDELRPITCEVGLLPRTHGSALFTRGHTQSLAVTTLGTKMDEQRIEALEGDSWKSYMLHYNFPPFSVGEVRPIRGPGRREIGHGALAERAIQPVIPKDEVFPYTIRIVSDILESDASSSMATACAGSLSLMDAGVPVKASVAGVSIGLIQEGGQSVILTDMVGVEDHYGDMDFKVAGTREGITAIQMDLKIRGIDVPLIRRILEKARSAREKILDIMARTIDKPRAELSQYAPRIITIKVKPSQIGAIIGTGGKVIREIQDQTGATVDIEDDGTVTIASVDQSAGEAALAWVQRIVEEPEVGKVYEGVVKRVTPFGAFVEFLPGKEGLVHISELDVGRVRQVEDVACEGDSIQVKVINIDDQGKVRLSRKAVLDPGSSSSEHRKNPRPRGKGGKNRR